jgi:hypothetical protein
MATTSLTEPQVVSANPLNQYTNVISAEQPKRCGSHGSPAASVVTARMLQVCR